MCSIILLVIGCITVVSCSCPTNAEEAAARPTATWPKNTKYYPHAHPDSIDDPTPLDVYVHTPDPAFHWEESGQEYHGEHYTGYALNFTSQHWLTPEISSGYKWTHWLVVCVPNKPVTNTGYLYMDGPGYRPDPPKTIFPLMGELCDSAHYSSPSVSAHLMQIPDEPITFYTNETMRKGLHEDGLIAFTWRHFLNNDCEDPTWLLRFPMTKAGSWGMTAIQQFVAQKYPDVPPVKDFVISGASKRGWTTWTLAAVDNRVKAFIPMVAPFVRLEEVFTAAYRNIGEWSFALKDYVHYGIMDRFYSSQMGGIIKQVDPWTYIKRFTQPKLMICSSGDEFSPPASPSYFWDEMPGEKHFILLPNAEHSMGTALLTLSSDIRAFFSYIVTEQPRPAIEYDIINSNTTGKITMKVTSGNDELAFVEVWHARTQNRTARDFRLVTCFDIEKCFQPVFWVEKMLTPDSTGTYSYEMEPPIEGGFHGFYLMATFQNLFEKRQMRITTEVNVVPDFLPYPKCTTCGHGIGTDLYKQQ